MQDKAEKFISEWLLPELEASIVGRDDHGAYIYNKQITTYINIHKDKWQSKPSEPDKPIEPLLKPDEIYEYKAGKVTGMDVMNMLMPVIRKQEEIIALINKREGGGWRCVT